jgi:hypothetical protein
MDSNELKEIIFNRLNADTDLKAFIEDRLYFVSNPSDTLVYPYIVFKFVGNSLDRDSGAKYESPIVSFVLYDDSKSTLRISHIADCLDKNFDECEKELTAESFEIISVDRIAGKDMIIKSDLDNWMLAIDYCIQIQIQIGV